uniref:DNA topoisomerase (ATP-hydrolyzing) n=1 Tax=viral metagenome TaxID=1070528 RepID=A0A6C0D2A1_9ZZZZ
MALKSSGTISLDEKYQQKTDKEHILDNPDTYIGSIENVSGPMYIYDSKIIQKDIDYNPALYKLFDEGITNCRDHRVRTEQKKLVDDSTDVVTSIHIEISNNKITMTNNGDGIDVEEHPTYKIWIPEMIFGHLRTSTNYNKDEQKTTGGKNGFGFKLVLIWSTWGEIETVDAKRKLKYHQVFENNLDIIHKPKITSCKNKPYTRVSFIPDYKRLGLEGLSDDMLKLFQRRVYDIAGITTKDVKVKYNEEQLPVKDFNQYIQLFNDEDKVSETQDCWSYSVCLSDEFKQISFVNGIFTSKGGKHVDYIMQQITKKMVAYILKKKKVEVKPSIIKEQITIFLNSTIVNPSFDSQTKDYLNTPSSKFGSSCTVSDKFIEKLAALGVLNTSCELSEVKEKKESKKTDGAKTKTIRGIPKLIDANYAGTKKSCECVLILCEGDSAKSGIVSGLAANDRNIYGIYPMKGKLLNVRGEVLKKINENKEIAEIKKILGLETGKTYKDIEELRYGKVLFMTDQDLDGSHIKGLGINMFECLWPSLLKIPGFIGFMNTPILKATKGIKSLSFYNDNEYEAWKQSTSHDGWKVKYYKGLGTSTGKEFREYFEHKKIVEIEVGEKDTEDMDMLFNKKKAELRKEWLTNYDRDVHLDTSLTQITLGNFIHKEIIHFSKYDCDRSIPNLMDGLKVSQRKILFSAFEKNLANEIKVAQFSGYVSEHSGYHHGEASLNGAIVHMAQDFVGSNNINLLMPNGQFGTRLQGGKDSASERYIFTKLNTITRFLFKKADDAILKYLDDDGTPVEPIFYVPIIPMVLVNGAEGIGTGFSTKIPCFNPKDLIQYIRDVIQHKEPNRDLIPYYKGFKGTIQQENESRFITKGIFKENKNKIDITELPIGTWNEDYIIFLEKLVEDGTIKDYKDLSTDKNVNIQIVINATEDIEKTLKLTSTLSISNMNLFNEKEKLTHYTKPHEIIDDFIAKRIGYYETRKQHIIQVLEKELVLLENKYKYIQQVLEDTIDLRKKTTEQIYTILENFHYVKIEDSFNYLIKMAMDSVSIENVETLKKQYHTKQKELDVIKKTPIEESWINELNDLEKII